MAAVSWVEGGRREGEVGWGRGKGGRNDVYPLTCSGSLSMISMTPCRYPVHVWWDGPGQRIKVDVYGGLDSSGFDASTVGVKRSVFVK